MALALLQISQDSGEGGVYFFLLREDVAASVQDLFGSTLARELSSAYH